MKHPMLILAGLYLLGVLLGEWLPLPIPLLLGVTLAVGICTFAVGWLATRCLGAMSRSLGYLCDHLNMVAGLASSARTVLLAVLLILIGESNFIRQTAIISPHDLRLLIPSEGAIVTIRGKMVSSPDQRRTGFVERTLVQVNAESILLEDQWQPAFGRALISTTNQLSTEYFSGRMIQVDGVLAPPETTSSPGLFDYRNNLYRRGIHHELRADEFSNWKLLSQPSTPTRPLADVFRNWARQNFRKGLPEQDEALELLWTMSLGWRTALTGDVAAPFMQSGTMHLFAISGLHIALVAGILVALLRVTRLSRSWAGGIAIPLLWFYTAATGWQPSAVRASVMMTLVLGAWALKRPVNILNSLGAAAFLILLWDPQQLFRASFQLSFVVVFSLALVMPPVVEWLQARVSPDPYLPRQLWPRWRRWILEPSYWLVGALSVSFSAWLASAPLVAHHFHLFNPVALLANVPVVLCGILALASCMGSLLCGEWLEPVTILFNHSAWFFMRCMMDLSNWAASLPNAWQYVRSPEPWMMTGWYALLFGLGTRWFLRPQIRRWAMGGGIVFAIVLIVTLQIERQTIRLTFLSNSPVIHFEGAEKILIDCGNEQVAKFNVTRHLRSRGVDKIQNLILTHGVRHHVGGFPYILDSQTLQRVFLSHAKSSSKYHQQIFSKLADSPVVKIVVSSGETIGPWKVLHPAKDDDFSSSTDDALALLGEFHGVRILLISDLGSRGQQALLSAWNDLKADVVVTSIADRGQTLGPGLLQAVAPRVIVMQDSQFPVVERASKKLLARLRKSGAAVFSIREKGGIRLSIHPNGWNLENAKGTLWPSP